MSDSNISTRPVLPIKWQQHGERMLAVYARLHSAVRKPCTTVYHTSNCFQHLQWQLSCIADWAGRADSASAPLNQLFSDEVTETKEQMIWRAFDQYLDEGIVLYQDINSMRLMEYADLQPPLCDAMRHALNELGVFLQRSGNVLTQFDAYLDRIHYQVGDPLNVNLSYTMTAPPGLDEFRARMRAYENAQMINQQRIEEKNDRTNMWLGILAGFALFSFFDDD